MQRREAARETTPDHHRVRHRERPARQALGERGTEEPLGDEVARPLGRAVAEIAQERRMLHAAQRLDLALEARAIRGVVTGHPLDRDVALRLPIPGRVDGPHPSLAEPIAELVAIVEDLGLGGPFPRDHPQEPPERLIVDEGHGAAPPNSARVSSSSSSSLAVIARSSSIARRRKCRRVQARKFVTWLTRSPRASAISR